VVRKSAVYGLLGLLVAGMCGCGDSENAKEVSLEKKEALTRQEKPAGGKSFRIAVGGMITPKEGFAYYRRFLDYIGEKLGQHVEFVDREDYAEINALIRTRRVDAAFVCGGPYVDGQEAFGMELLVAPQAYGGTVYYSYIIVSKDSQMQHLEDLRGKTFAFTDPLSNTGKLVPTYMLAKMNESPDSFFKKYIFTKSHDKSIQAVAQGIVSGAAVDSLIWEYAHRTNQKFTAKTRIIKKSPPYGIPPVVVRPSLDPKIKRRLREIYVNAHNDKTGREILKGMMIDKFVPIDDGAYDSIREMKTWMKKRSVAGKAK